MSWCRWSTDIDNKCNSDLYIYESVGDVIAVHVAGRKRSNYANNPHPAHPWSYYQTTKDGWAKQYVTDSQLRQQWFDDHDEWINLPEEYSGKTYNFGYHELDSLREFLIQARKDGINFPDYIFEYIDEFEGENNVAV